MVKRDLPLCCIRLHSDPEISALVRPAKAVATLNLSLMIRFASVRWIAKARVYIYNFHPFRVRSQLPTTPGHLEIGVSKHCTSTPSWDWSPSLSISSNVYLDDMENSEL